MGVRTATAALCHSGDVMRVVHWNVRRCNDLSGACSRERVLKTLERLRPTLLTLNEVDLRQTPTLLEDLEEVVGLPHASFFGHVRGVYGNLLASAVPLRSIEHTHLEGGTQVRLGDGSVHRIARGLLGASVTVLGTDVRIAVTHLDHMSSAERQTQMRHCLQAHDAAPTEQCLVVGDLNALRRADYTAAQWEGHCSYNAERSWEAPADEAAPKGVLKQLQEAGFVDAFAVLERPPDWRAPPWSAHVGTDRPPYRIDYVWSRPPTAAFGRRLVPLSAAVELDSDDASDHQPVVVDFEAIAFDAGE